uniref:Uncharacterized protein n=1 Tax=Quercus lobata TaxID=97700 RepID=A0A7N2LVT9_QUELO
MGMGSKDQEGIPIPLHSFGSSIVRFVSLITEFQNNYLLKEYECGERFFFGVESVKVGLRKLDFGLQVAQREIPKYNSRIREWYLKVKDIVYQLEDLFEDTELQVMAESYDSPSLSKDKFEELLKDEGLDSFPYLKDASCIQGVYAQFSRGRNSLTVTLNSQLNYVPGYLFLRARPGSLPNPLLLLEHRLYLCLKLTSHILFDPIPIFLEQNTIKMPNSCHRKILFQSPTSKLRNFLAVGLSLRIVMQGK